MDLQATSLAIGSRLPQADSAAGKLEPSRTATIAPGNKVLKSFRDAIEILIPDSRAELSPAQSVEHKLTNMLRGATIPVSHIRLAKLCGKH